MVETRSGQMLPAHNQHAASFARRWRKAAVGGSDSHALPSAGTAYTEVAHARNKAEFFEGIRVGRGGCRRRARRVLQVDAGYFLHHCGLMRERPWTALLAPLAVFLPVATLATLAKEMAFAWYWSREATTTQRKRAQRELTEEWFRGGGASSGEVPMWP